MRWKNKKYIKYLCESFRWLKILVLKKCYVGLQTKACEDKVIKA